MSKTSVGKALEDFGPEQLRALILELYGKSKEVKEILDFFACPDIGKKTEACKTAIYKEATRFTRRAYRPRLSRIRAVIKRFRVLFEPDDAAVAELMVFAAVTLADVCAKAGTRDALRESVVKFLGEAEEFISAREELREYMLRLRKAMARMDAV